MTASLIGTPSARQGASGVNTAPVNLCAGVLEGEIIGVYFTQVSNTISFTDTQDLTVIGVGVGGVTASHGAAMFAKVATAADQTAAASGEVLDYWTVTRGQTVLTRALTFRITGHKGALTDIVGFARNEWASGTTTRPTPDLNAEADTMALWMYYGNGDTTTQIITDMIIAAPAVEFYDSQAAGTMGAKDMGIASEVRASAGLTGTRQIDYGGINPAGHAIGVFVRSAAVSNTPPATPTGLTVVRG